MSEVAIKVEFAPGTCICAHPKEAHVPGQPHPCRASFKDEVGFANERGDLLSVPHSFGCSCAGYDPAPPGFFEEFLRRIEANKDRPNARMVISSPMGRKALARELEGGPAAERVWRELPWW